MTVDEYDGDERVVPAALRGYRCWRLNEDNPIELFPLHADCSPPWPRRRATATCDKGLVDYQKYLSPGGYKRVHADRPPPVRACSCGFYATYGPEDYLDHLPRAWDAFDGKRHVFIHGSITASGRIRLGTKGFRSQYAQVEALWGWRSYFIARYYAVPWFLTRRAFLKQFPPHSVASLLERGGAIDEGIA